jgi:predicted ribosomally synthesized peptide with nif11-like leader
MSIGQAKAFVERMQSDDSFRGDIMEIEDVNMRLKAMRVAGYDCSKQQLESFMQSIELALTGHETECLNGEEAQMYRISSFEDVQILIKNGADYCNSNCCMGPANCNGLNKRNSGWIRFWGGRKWMAEM